MSLNVTTDELSRVGNNITSVGSSVRNTYTELHSTIDMITSSNYWKGDARDTFRNQFDEIKPSFEKNLSELEDLGPAICAAANNYTDAEQENVSSINKFNDYHQI